MNSSSAPRPRPTRRIALTAGGASIAALLAACGSEDPTRGAGGPGGSGGSDGGGGGGSVDEDILARIQENGSIRIGLEGTYRPYAFHDDSGELVGFEKDIADKIAEGLGVTPEYIETEWDSLIAGLDVDRYDLVIKNVGITEERQQKYAFTEPYAQSIGRIAVPEDSEVQTAEELEGKRSAQTATSNWAQQMEKLGAEIVPVQGFAEAIELVVQGRVDATANDFISFQTYQEEHPDAAFRLLDAELPTDVTVGVIMQQEQQPLLDAVDEILADMKEDGSLAAIYEQWVGQDITPEA
ncbi:transporter substrate-binding domain-containing protein [Brachybacterium sp. p3-SID957]|uniref:transporter substrate-binding domain-containing protein n=1 Tax=Brachybacterium sp. p3-SID957 TaxID=2916049 RepID=UPI00223C1710|nr:transporter substrate-binding domain-containing protein [Brachybacterium sp. p3-SID957]MCT1775906.1 transporter substrate-binding domain-containing protein [Brachybacterium sp. p3-SID957]